MKVIEGHLTDTNKKAIKAIINQGLMEGKVKNITYVLTKQENSFTVMVYKKDRGLVSCGGSALRISKHKASFIL